jgi:hypothetical protein
MWFPRRRWQGYVVSKEKMTGLCGFQGEDDRVMWFPNRSWSTRKKNLICHKSLTICSLLESQ